MPSEPWPPADQVPPAWPSVPPAAPPSGPPAASPPGPPTEVPAGPSAAWPPSPPTEAPGGPSPAWPPSPAAPAVAPGEIGPATDGVARRTSVLTVLTGLLTILGGLFFLGIERAVSTGMEEGQEPPVFLLFGAAALLWRGVSETLGWWMRTYTVTDDRLVIDEGVVTRHHRVVPYERVQQVDLHQTLLGQALNLASLRIDTAGEAGGTTVVLRLLDRRLAAGLRSYVLTRRSELQAQRAPTDATGDLPPTATDHDPRRSSGTPGGVVARPGAPAPPPRQLVRLTPGQLLTAAVTGPATVAAVLVLAAAAAVALVLGLGAGDTGPVLGTFGVLLPVLGLAAVASAVSTAVNLWDLRISVQGDDLLLQHGLFQVRSLSLPRRRVQHVGITASPLQRALGFASVTLHSASPATVAEQGTTAPRFHVPYVAGAELATALHQLLGGRWDLPELERRPPAAERRAILRRALAGGMLGSAALLIDWSGLLLVLVAAALGWLWGIVAHHRAGWAATAELIVLAHGVLVHRVALVPVARVQGARTTASPFQRRAGLATLHLDVAGSAAPSLYDMAVSPAEALRREVPRRAVAAARG